MIQQSIDFRETTERLWHLRKYDQYAYDQLMTLFYKSITPCECQSFCKENCRCMEYINQFLDQIELTLITETEVD